MIEKDAARRRTRQINKLKRLVGVDHRLGVGVPRDRARIMCADAEAEDAAVGESLDRIAKLLAGDQERDHG